jgi:hypothetical protein
MADYLTEAEALALPDGVIWPTAEDQFEFALDSDDRHQFSENYGASRAGEFWQCAWMREAVQSRETDPERAELALDQLSGIKSTALWNSFDDGSRQFVEEELEAASGGDYSTLIQDLEANCEPS